MALALFNPTPERLFENSLRELNRVAPEINFNRYRDLTIPRLEHGLKLLRESQRRIKHNMQFGAWNSDAIYVRHKRLAETIEYLIECKKKIRETETLIPGATYYNNIRRFGSRLIGEKCHFLNENIGWMPFNTHIGVAKAIEVLRFGEEEDFKKIYIEYADGRSNALIETTLEHITESSENALRKIEEYCDSRWDGSWPWEVPAPYLLREKIEERNTMREKSLREMNESMKKFISRLNEDEMSQYEILTMAADAEKKVDTMISSLGSLSSTSIEVQAALRASQGSDAAEQIEDQVAKPLNSAAAALSQLKAAFSNVQSVIKGEEPSAMGTADGGDLGGDDLPVPAGDVADDLVDVNLDGDDSERPIKDM